MNEYERRSSVGNMSGAKGHDNGLDTESSLSGSLAFTCPVCIKSYRKEKMLQVHMQEHIEDSLHRCQHCSKTFTSASKLKTHQSEHVTTAQKQKHKCEVCGKMFLDVSSLNYHKQTHEKNGELLPCKDCQMNNGVCFAHYKTKLSADVQNNKEPAHQNGKEKGGKVFLCKKCNKNFSDRLSLKKHKKDEHSSQRENVCKICNRAFQSNKQLTMHATFHNTDGAWECFYCHKKFNRAWKMKLHMGVSHTGKRPYICRFCGDDFLYPGNIMSHMKTVHNIWIVCKECGEPCESDEALNNHVCKVYQCKDCCFSFETMEKLSEHVKTCDIKQMPSPTASSVAEVSQSTVIEHCQPPNTTQSHSELYKNSHVQLPQSSQISVVNEIPANKYQGMLPLPINQNPPTFSHAQYSPEKYIHPITNDSLRIQTQLLKHFSNMQQKPLSPPSGSPAPILPFDKITASSLVPPIQQVGTKVSSPSTVPQRPHIPTYLTGTQSSPIPGLIPMHLPTLPVDLTDTARTNLQNGLQTNIKNSLHGNILNDLQGKLQNGLPTRDYQNGLPANIQSLKDLESLHQLQSTIQALYANTAPSMQQTINSLALSPLLQPSAAAAMAMLPALQALQQQTTTTTTVQSMQVPPPAVTNSNGCAISYAPSNYPMDLSKMSQVAKCDTTKALTKDKIPLSRSTSFSGISNIPEPVLPMDLCRSSSSSSKDYGGDGPTSMVSESEPEIQNGLKALAATNIFARPSQQIFNNHHSDYCCSKDKDDVKKQTANCSSSPEEPLQSDEIDTRPIVIHMHRPNGKAKHTEGNFYITKEDAQRLKLRKEHMERKKHLEGSDSIPAPSDFSLKAWLTAERSNSNKREDFVFSYGAPKNGSDSDRKESRIRLEMAQKQLKKQSEMSFEDLLQI